MIQNMRIGRKLALGFGVVIVLMLAIWGTAMQALSGLNRSIDELAVTRTPAAILAGKWNAELESTGKDMRAVFILPASALPEQFRKLREARAVRDRLHGEITKLATSERARAAMQSFAETRTQYLAMETEFLRLAEAGEVERAKEHLLTSVRALQLAYVAGLDRLVDVLAEEARTLAADSAAAVKVSFAVMSVVCAVGLAVALVFCWIVSAAVTRPVRAALVAAEGIAAGDLTVSFQTGRKDEIGQLMTALAQMTANLRVLVSEVASGAAMVSDGSVQIAQGNVDLSQRTEEQASTLEETASQMEEFTSTVTQNAENARQASKLAAGASDVALRGGHVMTEVVKTMTGISGASRKIAEIIGVIDSIAFQTNILALNAAVEAARAGEQGRGFAVVASEVRNLAQRSAQAAKEIKGLITDSGDKVEAGTRLVDQAGNTMQEIVTSVKKVSELISEIAAASQEQSSGIEQVSTAVTQMDQVVQQNASLVEEATAATESLKGQAKSLLELVSRFNTGHGAGPERRPQPESGTPVADAAAPQIAPIAVKPSPARVSLPGRAPAAAPASIGQWTEF